MYKDAQQQKKAQRKHYDNNKQDYISRARQRRDNLRRDVENYKADRGCCNCPETDPVCLDFHHINDDKLMSVSFAIINVGVSRVWEEIAKCIVICSNCHRKLHAGKITLPS